MVGGDRQCLTRNYLILQCIVGEVLLRCSQTGKKVQSKVRDLSLEDSEPVTANLLKKGARVIVEIGNTPYPAEFVEFIGTST